MSFPALVIKSARFATLFTRKLGYSVDVDFSLFKKTGCNVNTAPPAKLHLVCGNHNYSSWSLRAWLCLRKAGLEFTTTVLPMDTPEFEARIGELSPTRRVPVLWIDGSPVWDSLAIAETVSDRMPAPGLWPADPALRAFGRAVAAEMHSSFASLRAALPMNCRASGRQVAVSEEVARDVARVCSIWQQGRERAAAGGKWLLGDFSIADAMYAPVALRFHSYCIDLDPVSQDYLEYWLADPDMQAWLALAAAESWVIEHEEVGSLAG